MSVLSRFEFRRKVQADGSCIIPHSIRHNVDLEAGDEAVWNVTEEGDILVTFEKGKENREHGIDGE